jgi:hypothetical protein
MRVRVYRNLSPQYRKQRAWSIMAMEGPTKGRVVDVVDAAVVRDARFVVSEAGRQRVIRDKAKNVHAFVQGELGKTFKLNSLPVASDGNALLPQQNLNSRIDYDPYKMKAMRREDCKESVKDSKLVVASPAGVFAQLGRCKPKKRKLR